MAIVHRLRYAAFAVVSVALCGMQAGCAEPKVGATLTYEVDRDGDRDSAPTDMGSVVSIVDDRVAGLGKALALTGESFAVDVYGDGDAATLEAVRRRVGANGVLEFRILASPAIPQHQKVIDMAENLPADAGDVVKIDEQVAAQWIDCDPAEFPDVEALRQRGLAARQVGGRLQALMLTDDDLNVTGDMIRTSAASIDEKGKPEVNFSFDAKGAFLFGQLTGKHVPTRTGQQYNLGIVLDKRLLSAPTIESRITDRARISGNMNEAEVESLVAILNAGRLPYPVREITAESAGGVEAED